MAWLTKISQFAGRRISHFIVDGRAACAELPLHDRSKYLDQKLPDSHLCILCRRFYPDDKCACANCLMRERSAKTKKPPRAPKVDLRPTPTEHTILAHMLTLDGWDEVDGVGTIEEILELEKRGFVRSEAIDGVVCAASFTEKGRRTAVARRTHERKSMNT